MKFETADKAALRLGCTVRAVQKRAKEGKIPNAHKVGGVWLIPTEEEREKNQTAKKQDIKGYPLPICRAYKIGEYLQNINCIEDEDEKNQALCGYYYLIGEFEKTAEIAEQYLTSSNPFYRSNAAVFCIFSNICMGHINKSYYASDVLKETLEKGITENAAKKVTASNIVSLLIVKTQLHLSVENIPSLWEYIKYLPEQVRMFACYIMAYTQYLQKDYSKSLGIAETAMNFASESSPVSMIYLYIIQAINCINLLRIDDAMKCIEKAWELASPDGLLMPFVEHYSLLQGLIEKHFKKFHRDDYNRIISLTKGYNLNWYKVYNDRNDGTLAQNLTHTEFTIAMLYSRNWRAKEIAAHMELSERTIMNYIAVIYGKLHINSKKELEKFMLK